MTMQPSACLVGQGWRLKALGAEVIGFEKVIQTNQPDQIEPALKTISQCVSKGRIAVGFIAYEAAAAFGLPAHFTSSTPLLWFGITSPQALQPFEQWPKRFDEESDCIQHTIDAENYAHSFGRIKDYIAAGDTYQVNHTVRAQIDMAGAPRAWFKQLYEAQPCPYSALIDTGEQMILSLSPELFLERNGKQILSRPMKGTIARGRFDEEDEALRQRLQASEKERAENIMIVDMMRNDLGRICEYGSVEASNLFHAERYRTLWQMTSEVAGTLREPASLFEILAATFPAASITGAPKRRTMQIIRELEPQPRGVYCGAVGLFRSERDFTLNVAIRTLSGANQRYALGLGGGIVWDSNVESERRELDVKARFVSTYCPEFELIETVRYSHCDGFAFLPEHLLRLQRSAHYWDFQYDESAVRSALTDYANKIQQSECAIRIALNLHGSVAISHRDITTVPECVVVRFSDAPIDSSDRFYFHKTTNRAVYNQERRRAIEDGIFETLFINEKG
ncbi:aminodeoxychorismate synthase component I, partial [bacterium]|nr:aminodeoxychorismate synthase component I [bacterium]